MLKWSSLLLWFKLVRLIKFHKHCMTVTDEAFVMQPKYFSKHFNSLFNLIKQVFLKYMYVDVAVQILNFALSLAISSPQSFISDMQYTVSYVRPHQSWKYSRAWLDLGLPPVFWLTYSIQFNTQVTELYSTTLTLEIIESWFRCCDSHLLRFKFG